MSVNVVCISGNLGHDPELRRTNSGTAVLSFSLAVNDRVKDQSGNWVDRPNWVDCIVFGTRAEKLSQYLHKGSKASLQGKLRYSSWQAQDGSKRSKLEVVVDEIEFMSRRRDQEPAQAPMAAPMAVPMTGQLPDIYAGDIPF